ncbi:hypothetical protein [Microbacterium album]|uniref:Lipoprotein n=1 Tax=Microbacterium album TaxID=2053191 RepID=A0A917IJX7_9MICO|nr:hypothetical protein [Microbacterium album]GGH51680.1 hypothetical protein GCM10010921_31210 [Microbacterium album]
MTRRLLPLLAVLALPLTACATGTAAAGGSPAPSPETSASPSAAPSPSPTVESPAPPSGPTLDDPSTWEISTAGIGPVLLGGDLQETAALFGLEVDGGNGHPNPDCHSVRIPVGDHELLVSGLDDTIVTLFLREPAADQGSPAELDPRGPRTADGFGVGTPVAEIERVRGPFTDKSHDSHAWVENDGARHVTLTSGRTDQDPTAHAVVESLTVYENDAPEWPHCID